MCRIPREHPTYIIQMQKISTVAGRALVQPPTTGKDEKIVSHAIEHLAQLEPSLPRLY